MCVLPDCNPRFEDTHLQSAHTAGCLGMRGTRLLHLLRILLINLLRQFQAVASCVYTLPQAPY